MVHFAAALGWHMLVVSTTACASPAADAWMTSRSAAHPAGATWEEAVIASVDADLQGALPANAPDRSRVQRLVPLSACRSK